MVQNKTSQLNAVERIYRSYPDFTESNRILADFFMNNLEIATFKSVNELKTLAGVSDATVIRFAYELGYSSFKEFREHLADYIRKIIYSKLPDSESKDHGASSIETVMRADIDYITRTMEAVDRERFAQFVTLVAKAKTIYVMGWRISSFLAEFLAFQLQRMGYNARAVVRERRPLVEQVLHIEEGDMLVAFDQIIYSTEIYDAVEYLARNKPGTPIVTLTSDPLAQIVQHADLSFFLDFSGQRDFSLISLSAPMCFVNSLIESLFARDPARARERLQLYEKSVLTRPQYAMLITPWKAPKKRTVPKKTRGKRPPKGGDDPDA